jgi:hypothetical protein
MASAPATLQFAVTLNGPATVDPAMGAEIVTDAKAQVHSKNAAPDTISFNISPSLLGKLKSQFGCIKKMTCVFNMDNAAVLSNSLIIDATSQFQPLRAELFARSCSSRNWVFSSLEPGGHYEENI